MSDEQWFPCQIVMHCEPCDVMEAFIAHNMEEFQRIRKMVRATHGTWCRMRAMQPIPTAKLVWRIHGKS